MTPASALSSGAGFVRVLALMVGLWTRIIQSTVIGGEICPTGAFTLISAAVARLCWFQHFKKAGEPRARELIPNERLSWARGLHRKE
jgi:hypothetical protein